MADSDNIVDIDGEPEAAPALDPKEAKAQAKAAESAITRFITGIGKGEALGAPAMVAATELIAKDKNTTPAAKLMTFLINRGLGEERIFSGVLRAYFGDGVLKGRKDTDHPLGYSFNVKGFARGIQPRNTWGQVTEAVEKGLAYNSTAFKTMLKTMFAKPEPEVEENRETEERKEQEKLEKKLEKDFAAAFALNMRKEFLLELLRRTYDRADMGKAPAADAA